MSHPGTVPDSIVEDLVFDVGMHSGQDTAFYLAKGYRVVAFEGNPELAQRCRTDFAEAIAAGRLTIAEGVIDDVAASHTVFYRPVQAELSALGSTDENWLVERGVEMEPIRVPTLDLGAYLQRFGVPFYLKMDIEGAERVCLNALARFALRPAYLSLESERRDFGLLVAELDLLERLGYTRFMAVPQGDADRTIATETLAGEPLEYLFDSSSSGPFGDDLVGGWVPRRAIQRRYKLDFYRRRIVRQLRRSQRGRRLALRLHRRFPALGRYYDTHAMHALTSPDRSRRHGAGIGQAAVTSSPSRR